MTTKCNACEITGHPCSQPATRKAWYMPEQHRSSHIAAMNGDEASAAAQFTTSRAAGAVRVDICDACAAALSDDEWVKV